MPPDKQIRIPLVVAFCCIAVTAILAWSGHFIMAADVDLGGTAAGDSHPILDTTDVIKDDADATKLLRFELSGITTGTTRTVSVPDSDLTLIENTDTCADNEDIRADGTGGNVQCSGWTTDDSGDRRSGTATGDVLLKQNLFVGWAAFCNASNNCTGNSEAWFALNDSGVVQINAGTGQGFSLGSGGNPDLSVDGAQTFFTIDRVGLRHDHDADNNFNFECDADTFCQVDGNDDGSVEWRADASGFSIGATGTATAISASIRATATIDYASIAAQTCIDNTITVTGTAVGSECSYSLPAAINAGLSATCFISAASTCTVRLCNVTSGAVDPASATFGCRTWEP